MHSDSFMRWFDLVFPPLMIVSFPLICFFIPNRPESDELAARARRFTVQLWLLAFISLAIYYVAYTLGGGGQWRQLWVLCFLQMPLANKLMAAKNTSYGAPHVGHTRVAALSNREAESTILRKAWVYVWALWALFGVVSAWGYYHNSLPTRLGLMIVMFLGMTAVFLSFGPTLVRMVSREPEPMDPHSSPELAAAYKKHRNARRWLFFSLPTTMVVMFGGCSVAIAWLATNPTSEANIGLYGGIAGAIVGLTGGIGGLCFGVWRARLNQRIRDLTSRQRESLA